MEEIINNNMTIQEKLRDRIYELLPEKKELSFGCRVIMPHNIDGDYDVISALYYGEKFSFELSLRGNRSFFPEDVKEIIGQPLRLADLLLAIEKTNSEYEKPERPYNIHLDFQATWIKGNHLLITHAKGHPRLNKEGQYNLQDDNILDQSDEFCEFAYELIK